METLSSIDLQTIAIWLALGAVAGIVVHLIDQGKVKGGLVATVLTGLIGAFIGGLLSPLITGFSITGFNLESVLIAVAGALVLIILERILFRNTGHFKTMSKQITE